MGDALLLGLVLVFGAPQVVFGAAAAAGVVAAAACELLARHDRAKLEPWRLDGFTALVATVALLGLGACVGLEASGVVWLLVALIAGLGLASLPNLAPRPRP